MDKALIYFKMEIFSREITKTVNQVAKVFTDGKMEQATLDNLRKVVNKGTESGKRGLNFEAISMKAILSVT